MQARRAKSAKLLGYTVKDGFGRECLISENALTVGQDGLEIRLLRQVNWISSAGLSHTRPPSGGADMASEPPMRLVENGSTLCTSIEHALRIPPCRRTTLRSSKPSLRCIPTTEDPPARLLLLTRKRPDWRTVLDFSRPRNMTIRPTRLSLSSPHGRDGLRSVRYWMLGF